MAGTYGNCKLGGISGDGGERIYLLKTLRRPDAWVQKVRKNLQYTLFAGAQACSARWNRRSGVTMTKRTPELIVSLTSIPERIATLHLCLDSLLRQSLKPDRLLLWLSACESPDQQTLGQDRLPAHIKRLLARGLDVRWCRDIGCYGKIIPARRAYPHAILVTADDDLFYPRDWLEQLYTAYQKDTRHVYCHRAHSIRYDAEGRLLPYRQWDFEAQGFAGPSLDLFATGVGGVLYAPEHLQADLLKEEVFRKLCPTADDVWLNAMRRLNQVQVKKVADRSQPLQKIRIRNNRTLATYNVVNGQNDKQLASVNAIYSCFMGPTPARTR